MFTDQELKIKIQNAVSYFWESRRASANRNSTGQNADAGNRGAVTSGKNMDAFAGIVKDIVNCYHDEKLRVESGNNRFSLTLPGFFRATKDWDVIIFYENDLIAALEFKSQVGSFGNNFNNRIEESVGSAHDFWTANTENVFGEHEPPFLGWLMLIEDSAAAQSQVRINSPHFPVMQEFEGTSYQERYKIFCSKIIQKRLYSAACVFTSQKDGDSYTNLSAATSVELFFRKLISHLAICIAAHRSEQA